MALHGLETLSIESRGEFVRRRHRLEIKVSVFASQHRASRESRVHFVDVFWLELMDGLGP